MLKNWDSKIGNFSLFSFPRSCLSNMIADKIEKTFFGTKKLVFSAPQKRDHFFYFFNPNLRFWKFYPSFQMAIIWSIFKLSKKVRGVSELSEPQLSRYCANFHKLYSFLKLKKCNFCWSQVSAKIGLTVRQRWQACEACKELQKLVWNSNQSTRDNAQRAKNLWWSWSRAFYRSD